jgi:hypothetical protein
LDTLELVSVTPASGSSRALGYAACTWGVLGLLASLVEAIVRLTPHALEPLHQGMSPGASAGYVSFVLLNGYAEGYRGFQRAFAPRVAARARLLFHGPTLARTLLAPLFLMALVEASRRRLIANWVLVLVIVVLVLVLRRTPQPYRGIVDAGVVAGLVWGTLATLYFLVQALRGRAPAVDPELPP